MEPQLSTCCSVRPALRLLLLALAVGIAVGVVSAPALAQDDRKDLKKETRRLDLDEMSHAALDKVLADNERARLLFDNSYGWAAFHNLKVQIAVSGGGGSGVAVVKESGERTYMKMGTAGIGLGIGAQEYQVVFLFENRAAFERFVGSGWTADTSASAAAGERGVAKGTDFQGGVAHYLLVDNGVMAGADIAGTKYWKDGKLN